MMHEGIARQKVPGGKMLTVKLKYDDKIEEVQLIGDFFVFPENALPGIENSLIGMPSDSSTGAISEKIKEIARQEGIELIGVTPDAIAQAVIMAIR